MSDAVTEIIRKEGEESNDPTDHGGHTIKGISQRSNPDLFENGKVPNDAAIQQRYVDRYINGPGFARIPEVRLREQLIDFGVNSGPAIAIQALQRSLGVKVDGVLGPDTLHAIESCDGRLLNNAVVGERIMLIARICKKDPSQLVYINGWLKRALSFLV